MQGTDGICLVCAAKSNWHAKCRAMRGWSALFDLSKHLLDISGSIHIQAEAKQANRILTKKPTTPRQTLLARRKAKPLKVRADFDWYTKAYERFSISAKLSADKQHSPKPETLN